MRECSKLCQKKAIDCPVNECRFWIDYPEDQNCCLISIQEKGKMTLHEVADRMGVSFVRIAQIEKKALQKIKNLIKIDDFDDSGTN